MLGSVRHRPTPARFSKQFRKGDSPKFACRSNEGAPSLGSGSRISARTGAAQRPPPPARTDRYCSAPSITTRCRRSSKEPAERSRAPTGGRGTLSGASALLLALFMNVVEWVFSEVHVRDAAYPRSYAARPCRADLRAMGEATLGSPIPLQAAIKAHALCEEITHLGRKKSLIWGM